MGNRNELPHPVRELLAEIDEEILCWDGNGLDDAIIGVGYRYTAGPVALYDRDKVIEALMSDGMDEETAEEWFEFNMIGGWIGEMTPMVARLFEKEEIEMVLARRKTFEFVAWSPKDETEESFRKRTLEEFEEFVDELIEAELDEGGRDEEVKEDV